MQVCRPPRGASPSRLITIGWIVALSGLAASCFVAGFDVTTIGGSTTGAGGSATSSTTTSGGGTSTGGSSTCQHATWPSLPANPDPGPDDVEIVVAVRHVDFGETQADVGVSVGYDLDNRCTCQGEDSACLVPEAAQENICDGPEGRDNNAAYLFNHLLLYTDALTSAANNDNIARGDWTMLIRVRGYNGQPNDGQVEFTLFGSPGRDNDPCIADPAPVWDGSERWPVDVESLVFSGTGGAGGGTAEGGCAAMTEVIDGYSLDNPKFTDPSAYVSGGVVVANLPEAGISLAGADRIVHMNVTAGFMTARIEQDETSGGWALRDGLLVGRWKIVEFFRMLTDLDYNDEPVCPGTIAFELVKAEVCKFPDVASTLGGPTTPCDALSLGMSFDADPALLGMMWRTGATGNTCPQDPTTVTCD
jgi:hypothetical protein